MTTANHVIVGSSIAIAVKQPALALPLAFLSHFVLDSLPHFGYDRANYGALFRHKLSFFVLALDISGIIIVMLLFNVTILEVFLCSICAVLPDIEWPYRYFLYERRGKKINKNIFTRIHFDLNWGERPFGIVIEVMLFIAILIFMQHVYLI